MTTVALIYAIARMEGFFQSGSRAERNANPGNLNFAAWQTKYGARLETSLGDEMPRFACFPESNQGFAAMRELLNRNYLSLTLAAALNKWAPPTDGNNASSYLHGVCRMTGLTPDSVLTTENIG